MDNKELLQQILASPATAAFSRIRYVRSQMSEEEQAEFLGKLYLAAVEAREAGKLDAIADLLEEYEEKGVALLGARALAPKVEGIPWAKLKKPVRQSKVALITTGGFYVLDQQQPFVTDGDWSFRSIPVDIPRQRLGISHSHYDVSGAREDLNCIFPLDVFQEMEREGAIGALAGTAYSFMGFIPQPEGLINETAPEVAKRLLADGVDAVVLTAA